MLLVCVALSTKQSVAIGDEDSNVVPKPRFDQAKFEARLFATEGAWGGISGRIVFNGEIPEPKRIGGPIKDAAVCGGVIDKSLVVDATTRGLQNCFVYLRRAPKPVHPLLESVPTEPVTVTVKKCCYVPRSVFTRAGQGITLLSDDPISHNPHQHVLRNHQSGILLAPNANGEGAWKLRYPLPESLPIKVGCDFHIQMVGHWLILDHPYASVTDAKGQFRIAGLPAGPHEFRIWHERFGYINKSYQVVVPDGKVREQSPVRVTAEQFR